MRRGCTMLTVACILGSSWSLDDLDAQQNQPQKVDGTRVQELIKHLGSSKFAKRERAAKELEAIGEPALQALRAVVKGAEAGQGLDLETTRRAAEILRRLEEKIATAQILAPKRVRLKVKNVSVLDAIKELEKQSQYSIMIQGDRNQLASKKITLDTGDTTFWEAFDQLCLKAGLVDASPYLSMVPAPPPPPIQIRLPIRIQPPRPLPVLPVIPPARPNQKPPVLNEVRAVAEAVAVADVVEIKAEVLPVKAQPVEAKPIEAKPVPARPVQAAPPVAVQLQIQPGRNPYHYMIPRPQTDQIQVTPGKPVAVATSYAGAVRIRARAVSNAAQKDEVTIVLDAFAEPRLQNFTLTSSPRVDKAIDDQGQALSLNINRGQPSVVANPWSDGTNPYAMMGPGNRQAMLRFKLGDKQAKSIKELTGSLTAQALTPAETLVSVSDILKAGGKTVKGVDGASIHVISAQKQDNGTISIQVRMDNLPGQNAWGGINKVVWIQQMQIQGGGNIVIDGMPGNQPSLPTLVDRDGKNFQLVNIPSRRMQINNGQMSHEMTMVFRGNPGQTDPARLLLTGQRTVTFQVPFAFKNVSVQREPAAPVP